jgi:bifunctional non-homologous end joining protein LigD
MSQKHQSVHLYFREGGSDKVYEPSIVDLGNGSYDVVASYGRRGATLQRAVKATGVDLARATKAYDKLVSEKVAKGYRPDDTAPAATLAAVSERDGQRANVPVQLLTDVEGDELDTLLEDPSIVALQKMDGERRLLVIAADGAIAGVNRRGLFVALPGALAAAVALLPTDSILDGELIADTLYVFDMQRYAGEDLTGYGFLDRLGAAADDIAARCEGAPALQVVPHVVSDKRRYLEQLQAENAEGIVLRNARAPYSAGRPNSGGTARKFKFVTSATVEVAAVNDGRRSVAVRVYDGESAIDVGNVTIPPNHAVPAVGTLVEVRYLYAYEGGSLYQPVYLGPRTDLERADAALSRLKFRREPVAAAG